MRSIYVRKERFGEVLEIMCVCRGVTIFQSEFVPYPDRECIFFEASDDACRQLLIYLDNTMKGRRGIEFSSDFPGFTKPQVNGLL